MKEIRLNENIRTLRKKMGIGQDALASRLGVTVQAVSKWETGGSMPDITLIPEIASFFGVTMEALYFDDLSAAPQAEAPAETAQVAEIDAVPAAGDDTAGDGPETPEAEKDEDIPHFDGRDKSEFGWSREYRFSDLENLGRTISDNISGQMKKLGGNIRVILGQADRWANENRVRDELPDDGILRVAQFRGDKLVSIDEVQGDTAIRLALDPDSNQKLDVKVYGSAVIDGDVKGSLSSDGDVRCKEVLGAITADGSVDVAGSVRGNVNADGNVRCEGNIGGQVTADGDVTCGTVGGNVRAEGSVHCGNVGGSVTSEADVNCNQVMGNVTAEGSVNCAAVRGKIRSND